MRKLALRAATALGSIVATAIITNFITGQPPTGLTKLSGYYRTFIKSSVPAWTFAVVLLFLLLTAYYAYTHRPLRQGMVHFVPDATNCVWKVQNNGTMTVGIGGHFTYDGAESLIVLKAFLEGSDSPQNMIAKVTPKGFYRIPMGTRPITNRSTFVLPSNSATEVFITLLDVTPILGTPGQPLRRRLILRDKYNRDFPVGPIEFVYR